MNPIRKIARQFGVELTRYNHATRMASDAGYALQQKLGSRTAATIFDVGANTGQTAKSYRQLFPTATIFSFEPATETFRQLQDNVRDDSRVRTFQLALSESDGEREFFENSDPTCSSLLPPSDSIANPGLRSQLAHVGSATVQCARLDSFCAQQGVERIDLLKMDIQGAELQAIRGASRMLENGRIGLVYCEVLFAPLYKDACDFASVFQAMTGYGYSLYGLYGMHHFEKEGLLWGDALFVAPEVASRSPVGS